jgi:hypothetical protein
VLIYSGNLFPKCLMCFELSGLWFSQFLCTLLRFDLHILQAKYIKDVVVTIAPFSLRRGGHAEMYERREGR